MGVTGVVGLGVIGVEGLGLTGTVGLGVENVFGFSILCVFGLETLFSLLVDCGFSVFPSGFDPIVCGRSEGYLPSEKVCVLLLSAGLSTLLRTVVVGLGTFGVGGTFGAIFR